MFQEVTGLQAETSVVEDHVNDSNRFASIKMPGLAKAGTVTLKKGLFVADSGLWTWLNSISMNTISRCTMTVILLDQTGTPACTWTLSNAWPTKISGTELKSDGNEVAIENLEIAYETLTIAIG